MIDFTEATDVLTEADDDVVLDGPGRPDGPFGIRDERSANWLVRRVVELRAYAQRVQVWADAEVRQARAAEQHLMVRYGPQLERWARERLAQAGGRRRSVNLPAGVVGFRMQPGRVVVQDERAVLAWCRQHLPEAVGVRASAAGGAGAALAEVAGRYPDDVRLDEGVQLSVLCRHVGETGECVPGSDVAAPVDAFYVK